MTELAARKNAAKKVVSNKRVTRNTKKKREIESQAIIAIKKIQQEKVSAPITGNSKSSKSLGEKESDSGEILTSFQEVNALEPDTSPSLLQEEETQDSSTLNTAPEKDEAAKTSALENTYLDASSLVAVLENIRSSIDEMKNELKKNSKTASNLTAKLEIFLESGGQDIANDDKRLR